MSKGKAFIEYTKHEDARRAVNEMNGATVDGAEIQVEWSGDRPQPGGGEMNTLFVGNLGFRTEQWAVEEFFKPCGEIAMVRMAKDEEGRSRGFAHVEFTSAEGASEGMKYNGYELEGRALRLDLS